MGGIASRGQLRWSFARWAAVAVPLVLLIGFGSGRSAPTGDDNAWYMALAKPALNPPNWAFPVAWTIIYICMGLAVAAVLNARGAGGRWPGVALFALTVVLLAAWTPVFFGAQWIGAGLGVILAILLAGIVTTVLFARVRKPAAWLMVPLLVWVTFAAGLNWRIGQLNPDAERVAPGARTSQML
ncbi:TspO/MBR family protein [Sphingomonas sp.]|jgi:tryptophan-rich sensory protein|uniref:TspO/MBR family protein n=1 Tax=Sphingomonas sp. TaxID=28214 RepID=UPI002D7FD4EB|nr:TspO/MBR family protein [Sphingomonas sp.]HEU0044626.1 TspO/MBR family protein [Sphingomonas sp.]